MFNVCDPLEQPTEGRLCRKDTKVVTESKSPYRNYNPSDHPSKQAGESWSLSLSEETAPDSETWDYLKVLGSSEKPFHSSI